MRACRVVLVGACVACGAVASTSSFAAGSGHSSAGPSYTCNGNIVKLFDNTNPITLLNGGKSPSFGTGGKAYCVTSIETYHWNNGKGEPPGKIGLAGNSSVAPVQAKGNGGQGSVANASWTATFSTQTDPQVIDGTYVCEDSDPSTWSQNQQSGGKGMCIVYAVPAQATSAGSTSTTATTPHGGSSQPSRCLSSATDCWNSPDFQGLTVTVAPAIPAIAGSPKAVEITLTNTGKYPLPIESFQVYPTKGAVTKCGHVCDVPLNGQSGLKWCTVERPLLICDHLPLAERKGASPELNPGASVQLTILDYEGDICPASAYVDLGDFFKDIDLPLGSTIPALLEDKIASCKA